MPMIGNAADEEVIKAGIPRAETALVALEQIIGDRPYLAGDRLSLADLMLVPIYDYMTQIPEGQQLLAKAPKLKRWWDKVSTLPSVEKTKPALG
jgi:glutathione S-transferase